ncbi:hypothetical protein COM50_20770 [Bacillus pseudomycoides]|nr:hypothetical protein COO06_25405 [Bacillus pseudomycoides]PGD93321.1 hypothetical protein COM50_20770 [Bacillus pseudomycoides]
MIYLVGVTIHAHQAKILESPHNEKMTSLRRAIYKNSAYFFVLCNCKFFNLMVMGDFGGKQYKKDFIRYDEIFFIHFF